LIKYIRVEKEAEESVSFAFGDEIRQGIVKPWRFPFLPIMIPYRLFSHYRKQRKQNSALTIDCLFIFDMEKMRMKDQKAFVSDALNYTENTISLCIGKPSIELTFDHQIPSRAEWQIEPREWNVSVENILLGLIRAYRPKRLVFVGKYPYAGIMGAIRRCTPQEQMYWISARGDQATIDERSKRFSKVKDLTYFVEHDEVVRNTIYFDEESSEMKEMLTETIRSNGINIINTLEHAEYLYVTHPETDVMKHLLRNQAVIYSSNSKIGKDVDIPNYVVSNLINVEEGHELSTIEKMLSYRKKRKTRSSAAISVQAKLDVWFNSTNDA